MMTKTGRGRLQLPDRAVTEKLYTSLRPDYELILNGVYQQLRTLTENEGLSLTIKYRVKRFENYCDKLVNLSKQQGSELIQITDLLGVRMVCPFLDDLETIERLIANNFEVLELERKAERHSFREFGYDSVHMLIRTEPLTRADHLPHSCDVCEIQLRTILQDAWAEVEHELVYKSDLPLPNDSIRRKLASLNASLALSDLIFQEIRDYQKEVRQRGRKRRQSFESILADATAEAIDISRMPDLEIDEEDGEPALPEHLASQRLEKSMFKALEAHSNDEFSRAISIYSNILRMKLEPKIRALVYNHRGMALFALAEYQRAIEDFTKALQYNKDNVRAWCNRGLVYRVQGKLDQSLEDFDRAIETAPQQMDGYWGRAQTCYEMKLFSRALSDCHQVISRQADFTAAQEFEKNLRRQIF